VDGRGRWRNDGSGTMHEKKTMPKITNNVFRMPLKVMDGLKTVLLNFLHSSESQNFEIFFPGRQNFFYLFQNFNSNIERLILAGNSVNEKTRNKESMNKARYLTKDEDAASVEAIQSLDEVLASLCVSLDVDIMPGEFDPANQILPQQPLHQCLFPRKFLELLRIVPVD
jgi:DNA polymerase II small subunit/DNA polymerase delta subunit B